MPDTIEKLFVKAFLNFLKRQVEQHNADAAESIEVAVQCLEAAYDITPESGQTEPSSDDGAVGGCSSNNPIEKIDLFELFQTAAVSVTPERKDQAEEIKNEGNRLMKESKYSEALLQYNRAISLDATNPVFYCNRAAAYIRLNEFDKAISDCRMSLLYNPNYSKAHGRMGIAYSNLQKYEEARQAYKRALELEPDNQDYQNNLRICEERLQQSSQNFGQQFLQNLPVDSQDLRNLISEMLNDPMISAASRQLVVQMANEYPDFISGFRQQLMNFTAAANRAGVGNQQSNDNPPGPSSQNAAGQQSQTSHQTPPGGQQQQQQQAPPQNAGNAQPHGSGGGGNPGTETIPQEELNVDLDELRRIHQRDGHVVDVVVRRPPVHQRQPPPRPGPEELIQQMAAAAGAAPRFEELPPSDGPNIRGAAAQQGQAPRSDGAGDEQSSD